MQITICDLCKKENTHKFFISTGTQPDVAGGKSEEVGETFDLCLDHTITIVDFFLEKFSFHSGENFEVKKGLVTTLNNRKL